MATAGSISCETTPLVFQRSRHITWPILLIAAVTVFAPLIDGGTTQLPVMILRLIIFMSAGLWAYHRMKLGCIELHGKNVFIMFGLLVGWTWLSLCWIPYKEAGLQWAVSLTMYGAFAYAVTHTVESFADMRKLVLLLLAMGAFEGVLGIIQYVFLGEPRSRGTFFNPNFFAIYQVAVLVLALVCLDSVCFDRSPFKYKLLLSMVITITLTAFLLAQSRGALVVLILVTGIFGLYRWGKISILVLGLLVALIVFVPNPLKQRIVEVSSHDPFAYSRLDIWKSSIERFLDRPLGVGLGAYKYSSFQYRFPVEDALVRYEKRAESAHNEYLQMAVEMGGVGLAIVLVGIGCWARQAWKSYCANRGNRSKQGMVLGMIGVVLVILLHAGVDSVFHEPALVLMLVLAGGLVLAEGRIESSRADERRLLPVSSVTFRLAAVCIPLVVLIALTIQPAAAWYAFEQGGRESQRNRADEAMQWYHLATTVDPWNASYHSVLGSEYAAKFYRSGDSQWLHDAIGEMQLGASLNPLDGRFPYREGTLYRLLADRMPPGASREECLDAAKSAFESSLKVDPFSPFGYVALGKLHWSRGGLEETRELLSKAIDYEPNFLPARLLRAELWVALGNQELRDREIATIRTIQERYRTQPLSQLDRQFLEIDHERLERLMTQKVAR